MHYSKKAIINQKIWTKDENSEQKYISGIRKNGQKWYYSGESEI